MENMKFLPGSLGAGGALAFWLNSDFEWEKQATSDVAEGIHEALRLERQREMTDKALKALRANPNDKQALAALFKVDKKSPSFPTLRLFEKITPSFEWVPTFDHKGSYAGVPNWHYRFDEPPSQSQMRDAFERGIDASLAVNCFMDLARGGLLSRMRQCLYCHKWLYASRPWQKFCSAACREKKFRTSPEGREDRRRYMADYRARLKRYSENHRKVSRSDKFLRG